MAPVARVNDLSDHGGHIASGSSTTTVDGRAVARNGDVHECPLHGTGTVLSTLNDVTVDGAAIVYVGCQTSCGAIIVTGSPTTYIENLV